MWQVEPVPAWDRKRRPLGQTQTSYTVCLVPEEEEEEEEEAFPSRRPSSRILVASREI